MGVFDALLGRILSDGTELEIQSGLDLKGGLAAVPNLAARTIELTLSDPVGAVVTAGRLTVTLSSVLADGWADLAGKRLANFYSSRGNQTAIPTGTGNTLLALDGAATALTRATVLGGTTSRHAVVGFGVEIEGSAGTAPAYDELLVAVWSDSAGTEFRIGDGGGTSNGFDTEVNFTATGPDSGVVYRVAFDASLGLTLSAARDASTARRARVTVQRHDGVARMA